MSVTVLSDITWGYRQIKMLVSCLYINFLFRIYSMFSQMVKLAEFIHLYVMWLLNPMKLSIMVDNEVSVRRFLSDDRGLRYFYYGEVPNYVY